MAFIQAADGESTWNMRESTFWALTKDNDEVHMALMCLYRTVSVPTLPYLSYQAVRRAAETGLRSITCPGPRWNEEPDVWCNSTSTLQLLPPLQSKWKATKLKTKESEQNSSIFTA